ncbi:DUF5060 domain-containing protein [Flammeovirgaceae bacterium SG7u.111]|nr:DUF5060 domain-containing protein [Flammeovirgaceae bacterium SG7u.132]WPO37824.1 DUF5060 domain-containing protein [Flammeovirgaceae bacterium SG7u.111]
MKWKLALLASLVLLIQFKTMAKPIVIEGELKQWHQVIFTLDGPKASEDAAENPFANYRLDMVFTSEKGTEYIVPGYFAADGNAANTSAKTGNKWRVIFTPTQTGTWKYKISFRKGENIAAIPYQEQPEAGKKAAKIDGQEGGFIIGVSDKTGVDFRSPDKGLLLFNGNRYLKYQGSERYYLKAGQGSPETFLAYKDFDDVRDLKGNFIHEYKVHAAHYNEADEDYTWKEGKGKNMLGAINYLSQQGVNSQYVILTTLKGDGDDSWPWADPEDFTRFDCSKLDQWNKVFTYMNHKGLLLTALLFEAENEQLLDDGEAMGLERKLYYREMIARFSHLLGLVWIISEETRLYHKFPPEYNATRIVHLTSIDPYKHSTGLHNGNINSSDYEDTPEFTYFALHASADNWSQAHAKVLYRVNEAKRRGHPWVVFFDECVSAQYGVKIDEEDPDHDLPRREGIWGTLLAGGGGVSWYYGYKHRQNDLYCEDFTLREKMFHQTKTAVDFFMDNNIPFWEMENRNDLVDNGRCLAKENEVYVVQLDGATFANMYFDKKVDYEVKWFDPKNGGALQNGTRKFISGKGTQSIGRPPSDPEKEWIVLIRSTEKKGTERVVFEEHDGKLLIEAEDLPLTENWSVEYSAENYSGKGYIVWKGGNHHQSPSEDLVEITIKIEQEGKYAFDWRNRVGIGDDPTDANDSWLRFPNAANVYGEKTVDGESSKVYPKGLGKTPEPEGAGTDGWFKVYSSRTLDWSWGCYVSDNDTHPIFVEFDEPGEYTLQISGRSQGHSIDQIRLRHSSVYSKETE